MASDWIFTEPMAILQLLKRCGPASAAAPIRAMMGCEFDQVPAQTSRNVVAFLGLGVAVSGCSRSIVSTRKVEEHLPARRVSKIGSLLTSASMWR